MVGSDQSPLPNLWTRQIEHSNTFYKEKTIKNNISHYLNNEVQEIPYLAQKDYDLILTMRIEQLKQNLCSACDIFHK